TRLLVDGDDVAVVGNAARIAVRGTAPRVRDRIAVRIDGARLAPADRQGTRGQDLRERRQRPVLSPHTPVPCADADADLQVAFDLRREIRVASARRAARTHAPRLARIELLAVEEVLRAPVALRPGLDGA